MEEIEARIAEHLEPARRDFERQRLLIEHMETVEVDIRSPDQTVKITQTCAGQVVNVEIAPGAFDKHDERSFAMVLKKALDAGREAGRQVAEKLTEEALQAHEGRQHGG